MNVNLFVHRVAMLSGRRFLNALPLLSRSLGTKEKSNVHLFQTGLKALAKFFVPGSAAFAYYRWATDNTNTLLKRLAEEFGNDVSMCAL